MKVHTNSLQGFTINYARNVFIQNYTDSCDIHDHYICRVGWQPGILICKHLLKYNR